MIALDPITIDAGVEDAFAVPLEQPVEAFAVRGATTVPLPVQPVSPGIIVQFPADVTKTWSEGDGLLRLTVGGQTVAEGPVNVVRRTLNKRALEAAAQMALAALVQMKNANDAGIAVIDAWLAGAMPTTVAQVVPVLRTLAGQNKGAAQQRNQLIGIVQTLIPLALQEYDG